MSKTTPEQNKAIVLEAFDTLFNQRDYASAERFWSPKYIQHSAHIPPGRQGLFSLVRSVPETMRYENQLIVAEGDYVIAHALLPSRGMTALPREEVFGKGPGACEGGGVQHPKGAAPAPTRWSSHRANRRICRTGRGASNR